MVGDAFGVVLAQAQGGDETAFAVLYTEFNGLVLRYLASRAGESAEDLAAEAWMGAARGIASFQGDERAFRAWLFTIVHRRLVQYWRDAQRCPTVPFNLEILSSRETGADDPSFEIIMADEATDVARRIAQTLPPDQANVVLLRVLGDLTVEEVGRILRKRPGTVRVLQHKALRRLARTFREEPVTIPSSGAM